MSLRPSGEGWAEGFLRMSEIGLTLVVPGLLGPIPQAHDEGFPSPDCAELERGLSKSSVCASPLISFEAALFSQFGLDPAASSFPVAALTWLADFDSVPEGNWVRADPVHLQADQDSVLLFGGPSIEIHINEVEPIVERFDELFGDDGYQLIPGAINRWYLKLPGEDYPVVDSLNDVNGHDINYRLPQGVESRHWRQLINEIQMMMHGLELNRTRESNGEPVLNGLWLWGGGSLPDSAHCDAGQIFANDPLSRGLAKLAGTAAQALPVSFSTQRCDQGSMLAVFTELHDIIATGALYHWPDWVKQFNQQWIVPALDSLTDGKIDRLRVIPCQGQQFDLTRGNLKYFWRRVQPLISRL